MSTEYEELMPFPRVGQRLIDFVDSTYANKLTYQFMEGQPLEIKETLAASILADGEPADLWVTPYGVLMASEHGLELLREVASTDFQSFPAKLDGSDGTVMIVNIISTIDRLSSGGARSHLARCADKPFAVYLSQELEHFRLLNSALGVDVIHHLAGDRLHGSHATAYPTADHRTLRRR